VEGVDIDLDHSVNPTSNVKRGSFVSRALGEDRTYWVYLPPGYEASIARYPALYLLHGMSQGPTWWTEVARVDRIVTSMIESEKIRPLIIVMPDGNGVEGDVSTTSLYDDRCQTGLDVVARAAKLIGDLLEGLRIYKISCEGDFEDYIVNEVVSEVDSAYRTNGERYIGGFSVGGRGALNLALAHNGLFDGAFGRERQLRLLPEGPEKREGPAGSRHEAVPGVGRPGPERGLRGAEHVSPPQRPRQNRG